MGDDPGGTGRMRKGKRRDEVFSVRLFRVVQSMLRATAYACDALMTTNLGFVVYGGQSLGIIEYAAGYSVFGFAILYTASHLLHFCWTFRALVAHNFLVYTILAANRNTGIEHLSLPVERLLLATGLLLLVVTPIRWICKGNQRYGGFPPR